MVEAELAGGVVAEGEDAAGGVEGDGVVVACGDLGNWSGECCEVVAGVVGFIERAGGEGEGGDSELAFGGEGVGGGGGEDAASAGEEEDVVASGGDVGYAAGVSGVEGVGGGANLSK